MKPLNPHDNTWDFCYYYKAHRLMRKMRPYVSQKLVQVTQLVLGRIGLDSGYVFLILREIKRRAMCHSYLHGENKTHLCGTFTGTIYCFMLNLGSSIWIISSLQRIHEIPMLSFYFSKYLKTIKILLFCYAISQIIVKQRRTTLQSTLLVQHIPGTPWISLCIYAMSIPSLIR